MKDYLPYAKEAAPTSCELDYIQKRLHRKIDQHAAAVMIGIHMMANAARYHIERMCRL